MTTRSIKAGLIARGNITTALIVASPPYSQRELSRLDHLSRGHSKGSLAVSMIVDETLGGSAEQCIIIRVVGPVGRNDFQALLGKIFTDVHCTMRWTNSATGTDVPTLNQMYRRFFGA